MAILENSCWVSPGATPESRAREAMKFVRVSLAGESARNGTLTDISISLILVELKRSGLRITDQ